MPVTSRGHVIVSRKSGARSQAQTGRKSRTFGTQAGDSHTLVVEEKGIQVGTYPEPENVKKKAEAVAAAMSQEAFPKIKEKSEEVFLFIRGNKEYVLRLKNAFVKDKRVVEVYGGKYVGMSDSICRVEGDLYSRLPEQCYVIIMFKNLKQCNLWTQSSAIFKQKDFPNPSDQLEMFAVPVQYIPQDELTACQMMELYALQVDSKQFKEKYVLPVTKLLNARRIHHGVVATADVSIRRNCMIRPHTFILLNFANNEKTLREFYDSPEYASLRDYRLNVADNNTCFFNIRPVTDRS